MTYDLETLLDDIETLVKANLNTKIAAINSEKNDSISLATIDSEAYFFQSLDGKQINYTPFVAYGISNFDSPEDGGHYGAAEIKVSIDVIVCLEDVGQDVNITKRMLRYQRALKEIIETNFDGLTSGVKLSVQNQLPIDVALLNSSNMHKAIGITIHAILG